MEPIIDPQLPREQAGFRHGRSTVDQIVLLTQNIEDSFEAKKKAGTGLPGGILGYQIDLNLVSKLLIWYPLFLFGILQKFGIRSPQIWYPTTDLVSLGEQSLLSKQLMLWICC